MNINSNFSMHNKNIPLNVILSTILLAFFADTKILNLIIITIFPSVSSAMGLMYMILVIGLVLTGIGRQTKYITNSIFNYVGISLLCIIWYIFTITFIGNPSVSIQHFCIFTIAAFLLPGIVNIDTRIFLLSLLIIPSIGILYFDQIILNSISEEGVLSMGK